MFDPNTVESFKSSLDAYYTWPASFPFKFIVPIEQSNQVIELLDDPNLTSRPSSNELLFKILLSNKNKLMITILDYGMGNLGSLVNMLNRIDVSVKIEKDPENILQSEKLILPGVGSFDAAMSKIESIVGMKDVLNEIIISLSLFEIFK